MLADAHTCTVAPARRAPRGPGGHLRDALVALAGPSAAVVRYNETPWASVTFEGSRHALALRYAGIEAISDGERLIAELADHEFAVPGHLVAEARVTAVDHRLIPEPQMEITCELLLLKDC